MYTKSKGASTIARPRHIIEDSVELVIRCFVSCFFPGIYIPRYTAISSKSLVRLSLTWNRYASPKAVERQKMKSRFGCSGMA